MTRPTRAAQAALMAAAFTAAGTPAHATQSFLQGTTMVFAHAFPSTDAGSNTSKLIGPGVEFIAAGSGVRYWEADVSDTGLVMTFPNAIHFTVPDTWTAPFTVSTKGSKLTLMNGLRLSDLGNRAPAIGTAVPLASTTLAGFSASRLRWSDDLLLVDLAGLTSKAGDVVALGLSPVPETSTGALWLLGLTGLAAVAGLRRAAPRR